MLGTDNVATTYHISSTAAYGWLAGGSDTASKPTRQHLRLPADLCETTSNSRDSARSARRALQTAARHRATEDEAAIRCDASLLGRLRC